MELEETLRNIAYTLLRFTAFSAHAFLFGLVPVLLLVFRPAFDRAGGPDAWSEGRKRLAERLEGLVGACLVASVMSTALLLLLQSALVSELGTGEITKGSFLSVLETTYGQWYALRLPLIAGLGVLVIGKVRTLSLGTGDDAPSNVWWGMWALIGIVLLATSTFSGHSSVATPRVLATANDLLHLAAGSVWFAGVIVLAVALPDAWVGREPLDRLRLLTPVVVRFSKVALVSIAIVAATGTLNSFLHIESVSDLWSESYGLALAGKLILFAGILGLGALNHYVVRARLQSALAEGTTTPTQSLFRRTIAYELTIAVALMLATGLLVGLSRTKKVDAAPAFERTAVHISVTNEG